MCHDIYDRARRMDHRVDGKRLAAVSVYELEAKHTSCHHAADCSQSETVSSTCENPVILGMASTLRGNGITVREIGGLPATSFAVEMWWRC